MRVFVLTAEVTGRFKADAVYYVTEPGDYDGITSVHTTQAGALVRFNDWLDENEIDRDAVHDADVDTIGFLGGDPNPDLLDGAELHWGINEMEVHE